ncbi:Fic family protein [Dialister invisus]|uniref:Fic family protein n=1 Tax=Dialister invisus TaxID=218538 RepID=UPI00307C9383
MGTTTLTKIYYTAPDSYEDIYHSRYDAPFTFHFGISIKQYNRQSAFPAFLYYTEEYALYTEKIYSAYERFLYLVNSVPPVILHQFALLSILDEVKSTNDIEGVHSTRKEIRDILDGNASGSNRLESVVNKYASLMDNVDIPFYTCRDIRHFYDDFAHKEITKENPQHALDGKIFRKDPVDIESETGKVIHRGVCPEEKIIEAMESALQLLHSSDFPLLVRLGLFHYLFAYIHPFYDGNGRTDRFITSYFLKKGFHKLLGLRLSVYIKRNRDKYYKLFAEADSEINRGDLTPFIIGFLQIVHGTIEDTISLLKRKHEQLKRYEKKIDDFGFSDTLLNNIYFILLQASFFYGRGITISELVKITGKARNTVQKRVDSIPKNHLAIEKKGKTYYYKLDLIIFK